jgi:hypothetical protein
LNALRCARSRCCSADEIAVLVHAALGMLVCRALAHNVIDFNLVEKEQRFVVAAECLSPGRTNLSV